MNNVCDAFCLSGFYKGPHGLERSLFQFKRSSHVKQLGTRDDQDNTN